MMLGNVAPAPLSFTCAPAGAARAARAARAASASREDFVMVRASSELEIDLSLEQGLRARGFLRRRGRSLIGHVVPVAEQAPIGGELVRHAADDASLLVCRVSRLRVEDVHARDDGGPCRRELVDAEGTVEVT